MRVYVKDHAGKMQVYEVNTECHKEAISLTEQEVLDDKSSPCLALILGGKPKKAKKEPA